MNKFSKRDRLPSSNRDNWRKKKLKLNHLLNHKEVCYKRGGSSYRVRDSHHAECFNCNSIEHPAINAIKF